MNSELLSRLCALTEEERGLLEDPTALPRSLYAKAGSFIVDRRLVSGHTAGEETAAIFLRRHPRFRAFPTHSHDFMELMVVCNGSITHTVGSETVRLAKDDLILLGRHTTHAVAAAQEGDLGINLIISPDLFEQLLRTVRRRLPHAGQALEGLLRREGPPYLVFHGGEHRGIRYLVESMLEAALDEGMAQAVLLEGSLSLLLCHLALICGDRAAAPERAEDLLRRRLTEYLRSSYSTATLTEAARMLGVSPAYLSRRVTEVFGVTFKTLLINERFSAAEELLCHTSLPVGEIYRRVGYETGPHFHKAFWCF